uniref:Uncharacterized protein n=1 Tax=Arundo donax TaxID=35708 RepID=A0A0A8Z3I6_ARUDO
MLVSSRSIWALGQFLILTYLWLILKAELRPPISVIETRGLPRNGNLVTQWLVQWFNFHRRTLLGKMPTLFATYFLNFIMILSRLSSQILR